MRSSEPWTLDIFLVATAMAVFAPLELIVRTTSAAYVLPDTPANRARGVVGCTQTATGIQCPRRGSGSGYSASPSAPSGPSPEEIERKREDMVLTLSDEAVNAYQRGDWAAAVHYLRKALEYDPHNPALLEDLKKAHMRLTQANEQKIQAERQKAAQQAAAAANQSDQVFDKGGAKAPPPPLITSERANAQPGAGVPPELKKRWQALEQQEKTLTRQQETAGKKEQDIQRKLESGKGGSAQLQVDLVKVREERSKAEVQLNVVAAKKKELRVEIEMVEADGKNPKTQ